MNEIENRIMFYIKRSYYVELATPDTTKLLGSTENKTRNGRNGKNVLHLENTEVILVHCNIVDY